MTELVFYPYETFEPAVNMAIDEYFLQTADRVVVRLYGWDPAAVSLGRSQDPDAAVDRQYCREKGIPIVRRSTGGAAVYHKDEITYMVAAPLRCFRNQDVIGTYRQIARHLLAVFRTLGVPCDFAGAVSREQRRNGMQQGVACFLLPSDYEIVVEGKKIVGNAQHRDRERLMQHGAIGWHFDYGETAAVLRASEASLQRKVACLAQYVPNLTPDQFQRTAVSVLREAGFRVDVRGPVLTEIPREKVFELVHRFPLQ